MSKFKCSWVDCPKCKPVDIDFIKKKFLRMPFKIVAMAQWMQLVEFLISQFSMSVAGAGNYMYTVTY